MASPQEMYAAIPPITRFWLTASFLTTVAVELKYLNPYHLVFLPEHVFTTAKTPEVWRLFTSFFFFGGFSMNFVISLFFLYNYSSKLERSPFATSGAYVGSTADYAFALVFVAAVLLVIGYVMETPFLAPSMGFAVVYLWSRKNPTAMVNFWGMTTKAVFLPFVLMAFTVLVGGSPVNDIYGLIAAHVYYFLVDVLPLKFPDRKFLETPQLFIRFVDWILNSYTPPPPLLRPGGPAPAGRGHVWGPGNRVGSAADLPPRNLND